MNENTKQGSTGGIQNNRPQRNNNRLRRAPEIRTLHKNTSPIRTAGKVLPSYRDAKRGVQRGSYSNGNNQKSVRRMPPARSNSQAVRKMSSRTMSTVPNPEKGVIRIIPLGGVEEIGKNMTAIEIDDDIIVIDAGMQFKTDDTPGIDYMIPNTTYLEERKDKIRAMIVTHGHLDHIGGIPIVMSRIGNPPLYSRNLSILMMKKRQEEFSHLPPLNTEVVERDSVIYAGKLRIRFFGVTHTVPDSMGIVIETPYGSIVTPGDYKLDQIDGIVTDEEEKEYKFFDKENVLLLLTDSTNVENEGFSLPEVRVHEGLEKLIKSG